MQCIILKRHQYRYPFPAVRWAKARTARPVVSGLSAEIGMTSQLGGSPRKVAAIFAPPQSLACSRHDRAVGGSGAPRSGSAVADALEQDRASPSGNACQNSTLAAGDPTEA